MGSFDLDQALSKALEVPDEGFTEQLMAQLPAAAPKPFLVRSQIITWALAAVAVLAIVVFATRDFEFTSWLTGSGLAIMTVSVILVLTHLDADTVGT